MTKKEALSYFGGDVRTCAEALGLSTQAVYEWDSDSIPLLRAYQIREMAATAKRLPGAIKRTARTANPASI